MVLDYPRYFKGRDVFAVRTLCWWGNSFSMALLLSGAYARRYHQILTERLRASSLSDDLFVCRHKDPWQHHFEPDNYLQSRDTEELCAGADQSYLQHEFIKLCRRFPLERWDDFLPAFGETQRYFLNLLH